MPWDTPLYAVENDDHQIPMEKQEKKNTEKHGKTMKKRYILRQTDLSPRLQKSALSDLFWHRHWESLQQIVDILMLVRTYYPIYLLFS